LIWHMLVITIKDLLPGSVGDSGDSSSSKDSGGSLLDALSKDSKSSKNSGSSIVDGSSSGGSAFDGNSSRKIEYKEFQEDYEAGLVDEEGNPIYLSIVSTNGG